MSDPRSRRLPPPGPSFAREKTVVLRPEDGTAAPRTIHLGMNRPSTTEDGWWTALLWARDDDGVVDCRDVAPAAGPPPEPPLVRMGAAFSGALAGFVAEENGRQALRLRLPLPADEARGWERPLVLQVAIKWEPMRAATMRPNELATQALTALRRAIESAGRAR